MAAAGDHSESDFGAKAFPYTDKSTQHQTSIRHCKNEKFTQKVQMTGDFEQRGASLNNDTEEENKDYVVATAATVI